MENLNDRSDVAASLARTVYILLKFGRLVGAFATEEDEQIFGLALIGALGIGGIDNQVLEARMGRYLREVSEGRIPTRQATWDSESELLYGYFCWCRDASARLAVENGKRNAD